MFEFEFLLLQKNFLAFAFLASLFNFGYCRKKNSRFFIQIDFKIWEMKKNLIEKWLKGEFEGKWIFLESTESKMYEERFRNCHLLSLHKFFFTEIGWHRQTPFSTIKKYNVCVRGKSSGMKWNFPFSQAFLVIKLN